MNKSNVTRLMMASAFALGAAFDSSIEHKGNSTPNKKSSNKSKKAKAKLKAQKNARKINRGKK